MVEEIYELKNQVLDRLAKDFREQGIERIDVAEAGKLADMVKDLAEAEKACWEAEYYKSVTGAMDGRSGYGMGRSGYQRGYDRQGYMRSGYQPMGHMDMAESVRMAMQGMNPAEREQMREQLRAVLEQ